MNAANAIRLSESRMFVEASTGADERALPEPTYATMEEVRYAHELKARLRTRLLRGILSAASCCTVAG